MGSLWIRQHVAACRGNRGAALAQEIGATGQRLLEEALVLEGFAEHDFEHAPMPGIGDGRETRLPASNERLGL